MNEAMDQDFVYFYTKLGFGPALKTRPVPRETVERFRGRLPDQLLKYWELYGWSGYGKGLLWTVDPDEYKPVMDAWIEDTLFPAYDDFQVIARGAFGKLFLWGKKSGQSLKIDAPYAMLIPHDYSEKVRAGRSDILLRRFFMGMAEDECGMQDELHRPLFDRALKTLGPLDSDEIYGFEPALAVGGRARLENLRKVKALEHLLILAQLGDRQILRDIVQDARNAGLMEKRP